MTVCRSLIAVAPGEAIDRNSGERFRWDEGGGIWRPIDVPVRKPETGELLREAPSTPAEGKCYLCRKREATIWPAFGVPKCGMCHDRFRRKSG